MSRLIKTVVSGGVVYPAGTPATEKLREKIPGRFWDEAPVAKPAEKAEVAEPETPAADQPADEPQPAKKAARKPAKKAARKPAKKAASPKGD